MLLEMPIAPTSRALGLLMDMQWLTISTPLDYLYAPIKLFCTTWRVHCHTFQSYVAATLNDQLLYIGIGMPWLKLKGVPVHI